jgi:hypothetical protein
MTPRMMFGLSARASVTKNMASCSFQVSVVNFGSNANNGSEAGAFNWNVNNDSTNDNRNIGTHLLIQS